MPCEGVLSRCVDSNYAEVFSDQWHASKQREAFLVPITIEPEFIEKHIKAQMLKMMNL